MLQVEIPGREPLTLEYLVLDYNGTIALDGALLPEAEENIRRLSAFLEIFVITSDTFGTVREQCTHLPLEIYVLQSMNHTREKRELIQRLGPKHCVAIGNGANDQEMLHEAVLGILVLGPEGCSREALDKADVLVRNITDAMDLLLYPKRLVATLRR